MAAWGGWIVLGEPITVKRFNSAAFGRHKGCHWIRSVDVNLDICRKTIDEKQLLKIRCCSADGGQSRRRIRLLGLYLLQQDDLLKISSGV